MEEIMSNFKRIITTIIAALLVLGMLPTFASAEEYTAEYTFTVPTAEAESGADEPLIVVGTISDPHTDYNLQGKDPYIRPTFITAMDTLKAEGVDVLLVGGDMTSDNQDNGGQYRWEKDVYDRTMEQYKTYSSAATSTGKTLWACGNHDPEVGTLVDGTFTEGDYNSYQGFIDMMLETCGEPLHLYKQSEDPSYGSNATYKDHWLGAHYNIKGFDFIVINPPHGYSLMYSPGLLSWLDTTLAEIGEEKTVFITGHYPLTDNRGISTPSYGLSSTAYRNFVKVMKKYDKAIYLYGHNHGGAESVYISSDTFERITHYDANGRVISDRNVKPTSYVTAFMGSAGYYKYSLNPDWLGAADPYIVQAMTISVYEDRIEFKMINCGKRTGAAKEPAVWTMSLSEDSTDETTQPETTQPETTKPVTTKPETTKPVTTKPETTKPVTTKPETTKPETTVPETTKPETTVPETTTDPETSTTPAPTDTTEEETTTDTSTETDTVASEGTTDGPTTPADSTEPDKGEKEDKPLNLLPVIIVVAVLLIAGGVVAFVLIKKKK